MTSKESCLSLYNVERWGEGYFSVDAGGNVCVHPDADGVSVRLTDVWQAAAREGLRQPLLLRFSGILRHRVTALAQAFHAAMQAQDYAGHYTSVYPIKVNQQRRVVTEILHARDAGATVGLEAGSKPELMAVLALSGRDGATIVCNGYKDREYIRLALMGEKLGFHVHLVVEKLSELALILEESARLKVQPRIGLRVRLLSVSKGNWQNSGGEKSKFGLSANQLLEAVEICRAAGKLDAICMLHFHLGSQVANLRDIRRGMEEAARYYEELNRLGAPVRVMDVGGGLGVDYEGTRSRSSCSMNYDLAGYAGEIVAALKARCAAAQLPVPDIFSESGRALSAHHAVLLTRVIDREVHREAVLPETVPALLQPLRELLLAASAAGANLVELHQELLAQWQSLHEDFLAGQVDLPTRGLAERIYINAQLAIRARLDASRRRQRELIDELDGKLADKLFINFSLFQSIPDAWGIDQIFPILPIAGLDAEPATRAVLQDITCDSDGRVDGYVDGEGVEATLPLPANHDGWLGIFMVGAYQEILGDMHNLFGDTDAVDVEIDAVGHIHLNHAIHGDTVSDVLRYVNFAPEKLLEALERRCREVALDDSERELFLAELGEGLEGYTYLE